MISCVSGRTLCSSVLSPWFMVHGGSFSLKFVDEKEEVPKKFHLKLQLQSRQHGSCRIFDLLLDLRFERFNATQIKRILLHHHIRSTRILLAFLAFFVKLLLLLLLINNLKWDYRPPSCLRASAEQPPSRPPPFQRMPPTNPPYRWLHQFHAQRRAHLPPRMTGRLILGQMQLPNKCPFTKTQKS